MIKQKYNPNSLLETLVIFSKLHGKPYSAEVLTEGLPASEKEAYPKLFAVKDKNAKSMFSRAAQRAGFKTRIIKIGLDEISELVLPCILLLNTDEGEVNGCILEGFDETKEHAYIIIPEIGDVVNKVPIDDLRRAYFGISFFLKKEFRFDSADFKVIDNSSKYVVILEGFIESNGMQKKKVLLLVGLIYINMAPLHHPPFNFLLIGLGTKILNDIMSISD